MFAQVKSDNLAGVTMDSCPNLMLKNDLKNVGLLKGLQVKVTKIILEQKLIILY